MHEITLCQRALEIVEQQAIQNGAKRVTGVWMKVGAFSCVETSAMTFCFDLVCRGTLAEGCELHVEEQEAECWCEACQLYVQLVSVLVRRCPQCNSDNLRIVADAAEPVVRRLLDADPALHELEVQRAGLADAFLELTRTTDDTTVEQKEAA